MKKKSNALFVDIKQKIVTYNNNHETNVEI